MPNDTAGLVPGRYKPNIGLFLLTGGLEETEPEGTYPKDLEPGASDLEDRMGLPDPGVTAGYSVSGCHPLSPAAPPWSMAEPSAGDLNILLSSPTDIPIGVSGGPGLSEKTLAPLSECSSNTGTLVPPS